MSEQPYLNISAYQFMPLPLEALPEWRQHLRTEAMRLGIKGSILLSHEGVNMFLAALPEAIAAFRVVLTELHAEFADLWFKESYSEAQPFSRMLVKIKKEIIAMGCDDIAPHTATAPYVTPQQLDEWYAAGKDMVLLDTRNDYEVALGTFEAAVDLNIKKFRDFPEAMVQLGDALKDKTVVTFCTGGIRCEKAAAWMQQQGYQDVYQLEGGILNYFEQSPHAHYQGECFVFDKRVAVDVDLQETPTTQCYGCRQPLTKAVQMAKLTHCPDCGYDISYCHTATSAAA